MRTVGVGKVSNLVKWDGSSLAKDESSERRLVRACQQGDQQAFEELVSRHQDRIFNLTYKLTGNFHDACDVTQETFLKAFQGLAGFKGRSSFLTWLYRIALNSALSHRKRSQATMTAPMWLASERSQSGGRLNPRSPVEPMAAAVAREELELIEQAITSLEEDLRAVVVLRDMEALDYGHIAQVLEIPQGTVKSRLHRARLELREKLRGLVE